MRYTFSAISVYSNRLLSGKFQAFLALRHLFSIQFGSLPAVWGPTSTRMWFRLNHLGNFAGSSAGPPRAPRVTALRAARRAATPRRGHRALPPPALSVRAYRA